MNKDLLERIAQSRKLQEQTMYEQQKAMDTSFGARTSERVTSVQKFISQFGAGIVWLFRTFIMPLIGWAIPLCMIVGQWYGKVWALAVHRHDKYNLPVFSNVRAGLMIVATVFVAFVIVPLAVQTAFYASWYGLTKNVNEHVIIYGSQQLEAISEGTHNVEGCVYSDDYFEKGCPDTETLYFHAEWNMFNLIYSILYKHELYWPEYVGAVPYSTSECSIISYGMREKFFMKDLSWYPILLAQTCRPLRDPHPKG